MESQTHIRHRCSVKSVVGDRYDCFGEVGGLGEHCEKVFGGVGVKGAWDDGAAAAFVVEVG